MIDNLPTSVQENLLCSLRTWAEAQVQAGHVVVARQVCCKVLGTFNLHDAYLVGANLAFANLSEAVLHHSDLRGANLTDAVLREADLRGASLIDANLTDAVLTGADLRDAVLCGADLTGADLSAADLRGADFTGAKLDGASLLNARIDDAKLGVTYINGHTFVQVGPYVCTKCGAHIDQRRDVKCSRHLPLGSYSTLQLHLKAIG